MILHINKDVYDKHVIAGLQKKKRGRLHQGAKDVIKATGTRAARMNRQGLKTGGPPGQGEAAAPRMPASPVRRQTVASSSKTGSSARPSQRESRRSFDNAIHNKASAEQREEEEDSFGVLETPQYAQMQHATHGGYAPEGSHRRRASVIIKPDGPPPVLPSGNRVAPTAEDQAGPSSRRSSIAALRGGSDDLNESKSGENIYMSRREMESIKAGRRRASII